MGGKVSPCIANIFVHMMEKNIIKNHIDQKNIISYHRYVDVIFCLVKKGLKEEIVNEMNAFDPFLKFTIENMTENKLNFLDKTINSENLKHQIV